jgi:hypothetical protein
MIFIFGSLSKMQKENLYIVQGIVRQINSILGLNHIGQIVIMFYCLDIGVKNMMKYFLNCFDLNYKK